MRLARVLKTPRAIKEHVNFRCINTRWQKMLQKKEMPAALLSSSRAKIARGYCPLPLVASMTYESAIASPPAFSAEP